MSKNKTELKTEAQKEREALQRRKDGANKEIEQLQAKLNELKVRYEQHFLGIEEFVPEKLHQEFIRFMRDIRNLSFLNVRDKFKIKSIEQRYQTFNNYWERTLKQREQGTYKRDVFKAQLHSEKNTKHPVTISPAKVKAKEARGLFNDLQEQVGEKKKQLDRQKFEKFAQSKIAELRKKNPTAKFKVVERNGKLGIVESK